MGMAATRAALTRGRGPLSFTPPSRRHVAGRAGERGRGERGEGPGAPRGSGTDPSRPPVAPGCAGYPRVLHPGMGGRGESLSLPGLRCLW